MEPVKSNKPNTENAEDLFKAKPSDLNLESFRPANISEKTDGLTVASKSNFRLGRK